MKNTSIEFPKMNQTVSSTEVTVTSIISETNHHNENISEDKLVASMGSLSNSNTRPVNTERLNPNTSELILPSASTSTHLLLSNGSLPKSGKPMMLDKSTKKSIKQKSRVKQKASVPLYQSQIKDNNVGIKLCIKKSCDSTFPGLKMKQIRSKRTKTKSDNDTGKTEHSSKPKKMKTKGKQIMDCSSENIHLIQSPFGNLLPEHILHEIFSLVISANGALPDLARMCQVCSLWRRVALSSSLWRSVDLSAWPKERQRTEFYLKWLIENRFHDSRELVLSNWKVKNVDCLLEKLLVTSPNLEGISLAGWKELTSDQLFTLVSKFEKLSKLDLSSINAETNIGKTAVGATSICSALQVMGSRLVSLQLANNRLANLPQIITKLASSCPNLELLDLSNVTTIAASHGILHVEKLQHGCQKLKVLRITNSHITLSQSSLTEQMDAPGFPCLEELSIASLVDESRIFNDDCLQRVLKSSVKLKLLDVRGCARLTHDSIIRLPTWDLKHLFLSGCSVTRDTSSGLELIASKYAHSLTELDLAWANVQQPLDSALKAIAEKGHDSPLSHLNLCGSSVSEEAVKEILQNCPSLTSINLSSCRSLPRGVKRPLSGQHEINELRETLKVTLK